MRKGNSNNNSSGAAQTFLITSSHKPSELKQTLNIQFSLKLSGMLEMQLSWQNTFYIAITAQYHGIMVHASHSSVQKLEAGRSQRQEEETVKAILEYI